MQSQKRTSTGSRGQYTGGCPGARLGFRDTRQKAGRYRPLPSGSARAPVGSCPGCRSGWNRGTWTRDADGRPKILRERVGGSTPLPTALCKARSVPFAIDRIDGGCRKGRVAGVKTQHGRGHFYIQWPTLLDLRYELREHGARTNFFEVGHALTDKKAHRVQPTDAMPDLMGECLVKHIRRIWKTGQVRNDGIDGGPNSKFARRP